MTESPDVGSISEEATKLLSAAAEWWHDARTRAGEATASMGHAAECQLCPFCQLVGMLRSTSPEVFEHLVAASHQLTLALRAVVDAHGTRGAATFERIDVDE